MTVPVVSKGVGGTAAWANSVAAMVNPTTWTAVSFANSWADYGAPYQTCQYRAIGDMVYLRGLMKLGTIGLAAFTLPAGFRPPADLAFAIQSNAVFGYLSITSAGVVTPVSGNNGGFWIPCEFSITA